MHDVAFLGLGIMGQRMAAKLVKAGNAVTVWNRTPGKKVVGAQTAATPREAAASAEVVWMCVSDTAAVEQVLFGNNGVQPALREGMVVVDSSTISPAATLDFAARVRARGADYIDAPMTGSKVGAEAGTLVFIVGGNSETIARVQPLFDAMGNKVVHMGDTSRGQAAKIVMNLQIAMIYQAFAEALTLATKLGLEPAKLVEVMQATMVRSGVVDYKAPFVLRADYTANFPLRLMHQDLHLALDAAKQTRVKLPGLEMVDEIYEIASEEGQDDLDYAATLMLLQKWAGLDVKQATS